MSIAIRLCSEKCTCFEEEGVECLH
uniref:Uncharacterized protein n=1 Tax=Rhizophora mucronata TaxID=61149 RepID=A0A2P2QR89_RHIMU